MLTYEHKFSETLCSILQEKNCKVDTDKSSDLQTLAKIWLQLIIHTASELTQSLESSAVSKTQNVGLSLEPLSS